LFLIWGRDLAITPIYVALFTASWQEIFENVFSCKPQASLSITTDWDHLPGITSLRLFTDGEDDAPAICLNSAIYSALSAVLQ
jgi:hypothetical protein